MKQLTFTCAECGAATDLVGRAPDGRLVCPVCLRRLGEGRSSAIGPTEFKGDGLDDSDFRGGRG